MLIFNHRIDLLPIQESDVERFPFLLESNSDSGGTHRYDLLMESASEYLQLDERGVTTGSGSSVQGGFLEALQRWFDAEHRPDDSVDPALPFRSGWFIYLGYELAAEIEPALNLPPSPDALPTAFAVRCRAAVVVDHLLDRTLVIAESTERAEALAETLRSRVTTAPETPPSKGPLSTPPEPEPAGNYIENVERIREYIRAGDVFQVNLSRRWTADLTEGVETRHLHRALTRANPSPFAALIRWGENAIISSSPERLVRVAGGIVETRPIAGTRPRGANAAQDAALSRELLAHYKERAEHIMLIDLERNDLGRICEPGSIEVNELMTLETYEHVHHIVSNIRGRMRSECSPLSALSASFPGGTITGCPKVRCMEIIAELEQRGRGPYTGSIGYLDVSGRLDMNILIRSIISNGRSIAFNAGAGIVADSVAEQERAETEAKALGMLRALGHGLNTAGATGK